MLELKRWRQAELGCQRAQLRTKRGIDRNTLGCPALLRLVFDLARDVDALAAGRRRTGVEQLNHFLHSPAELRAGHECIDAQRATAVGHLRGVADILIERSDLRGESAARKDSRQHVQ